MRTFSMAAFISLSVIAAAPASAGVTDECNRLNASEEFQADCMRLKQADAMIATYARIHLTQAAESEGLLVRFLDWRHW